MKGYFNNLLSCIKRDSKDSNGKNNGKEDDEEAKYNARFNPETQKCGSFEGIMDILLDSYGWFQIPGLVQSNDVKCNDDEP